MSNTLLPLLKKCAEMFYALGDPEYVLKDTQAGKDCFDLYTECQAAIDACEAEPVTNDELPKTKTSHSVPKYTIQFRFRRPGRSTFGKWLYYDCTFKETNRDKMLAQSKVCLQRWAEETGSVYESRCITEQHVYRED